MNMSVQKTEVRETIYREEQRGITLLTRREDSQCKHDAQAISREKEINASEKLSMVKLRNHTKWEYK